MLKERTYAAVKRMILSGALRPGEKLQERDLSRRLKVSRTPLREALSRLVQEGLVENRPRRGHYVRAIDAKSVEDLYDLREVLEKHAIRLAARRLTDDDIATLERLRRTLRKYGRDPIEGEAEQRDGLRLHEIIVRAARNEFLLETLTKLYDRLQMFVWIDAIYADEAALTRREHEAIIDAAQARDEKLLLRLMEQHLRRSKGNVLRALRARPSLAS
jgi:DNA-binding GntR family transcriptional regulator